MIVRASYWTDWPVCCCLSLYYFGGVEGLGCRRFCDCLVSEGVAGSWALSRCYFLLSVETLWIWRAWMDCPAGGRMIAHLGHSWQQPLVHCYWPATSYSWTGVAHPISITHRCWLLYSRVKYQLQSGPRCFAEEEVTCFHCATTISHLELEAQSNSLSSDQQEREVWIRYVSSSLSCFDLLSASCLNFISSTSSSTLLLEYSNCVYYCFLPNSSGKRCSWQE